MEGWYHKEGEAYIRINSAGLRDREHVKEKPSNTIRIAIIGDSYPEALQVKMEEAFWAVMEQRLKECGAFAGRDVEVINFGVSGYGTAQELITLRHHVWQYAPDIVLLAVTTNNDISDNSRALKKTDEIPYFVRRDGKLELDDSFQSSPAFRLRDSTLNRIGRSIRDGSRIIQAFHQTHAAIKSFIAMRRGQTAAAQNNSAPDMQEIGIDNMIYRAPEGEAWTEAWRVTEELIVVMHDEVRRRGAEFLVVTLSNGIQVYPDRKVREEFMYRIGASDAFYPDRRIKALGEREGFAVLNLAPALQAFAEQNNVFLHGFGRDAGNGHWNSIGHALAGNLIATELCDK
jgi:hypothetical protein